MSREQRPDPARRSGPGHGSPAADAGVDSISEARMADLVQDGVAQPLLSGHFPSPVRYAGVWWHSTTDQPDRYVRASDDACRTYEHLTRRLRFAHDRARR